MKRLPNIINEMSRKKDKLRRIDRMGQKNGRMSPYERVNEGTLINELDKLNFPIRVDGVYLASIGQTDFFKTTQKFLDCSTFLKFADALAISKGLSGRIYGERDGNYSKERMKKLSIRWHMPGDNSFFTPHAGGPGYDFPAHMFIDIYSIFDRVQEE